MNPNEIKLSSAALVEYLAGRLTRERLLEVVGPEPIAFLNRVLDSGRLLKTLSIQREPDLDDDYTVLKFGPAGSDPAISPFRHSGAEKQRSVE